MDATRRLELLRFDLKNVLIKKIRKDPFNSKSKFHVITTFSDFHIHEVRLMDYLILHGVEEKFTNYVTKILKGDKESFELAFQLISLKIKEIYENSIKSRKRPDDK